MTVLLLERAPGNVRGELTRFMLCISEGVFVGRLSATVREGLWDLVVARARPRTAAVLVHAADTWHYPPTSQPTDDVSASVTDIVAGGAESPHR